MKILILFTKWKGGVGSVVKAVKEGLENKGHAVVCVSREEDLRLKSTFGNILKLRKRFAEIIARENPDVIYTQDWSIAFPFLFPFPVWRNKHFCCFHGHQFGKTRYTQLIVGKILGEKLIVVGDSLKEVFPNAHRVYNGVDLNKFKPLNKPRDFIGWINKETEGISEKEFISLARRLSLKPLIAKNFSIPFDEMNEKFYNRCKVFVSIPKESAGFNLCWVEAISAGVPYIIGNERGIGVKINIINKDINKISNLESFKPRKNGQQELRNLGLTWDNSVKKLLNIWGNSYD